MTDPVAVDRSFFPTVGQLVAAARGRIGADLHDILDELREALAAPETTPVMSLFRGYTD